MSLNMNRTLSYLMLQVLLACIPGVCALVWFFGEGVLFNLLIATSSAVMFEAIMLRLRKRDIKHSLSDLSAVVTGVLLALALPPLLPWWMLVVGVGFAIIFAKHLYGGLGNNPFNPAMAGYALLLVSYPLEMSSWLSANTTENIADAFSGATPLDRFKTALSQGLSKPEFMHETVFNGVFSSAGWEWVNVGFLIGGIYLYSRKIINWHIPFSFLASLIILSSIGFAVDPDRFASPLFHLFSGGTMLGAFFIASDPVTAATSNRGRLIYGAGIGVLIYVIRTWGHYPDAIAFAVLLMNLCVPTIDYYTQSKTGGRT